MSRKVKFFIALVLSTCFMFGTISLANAYTWSSSLHVRAKVAGSTWYGIGNTVQLVNYQGTRTATTDNYSNAYFYNIPVGSVWIRYQDRTGVWHGFNYFNVRNNWGNWYYAYLYN